MKPSSRSRYAAAGACLGLVVLSSSLVARAQPGYPPPPPIAPSPYPPYPSSYPAGYPEPVALPGRLPFRPFTLGLGLGVGGLLFHDGYGRAREGGLSYTLRIGFGVTRGWLVFLGAEGTGTNHMKYGVWQTAYLLGLQHFFLNRLYLRAGVGVATATAADSGALTKGGTGPAFMAAGGLELAQGTSTSLAVEPSLTAARQGDGTWSNFGLNFVLSFY